MTKPAGKSFTKGQEVTYIADWDRKGTVTFRHAVVYSCGNKQMVLTDAETGEEMGRHFAPEVGSLVNITTEQRGVRIAGGTFPRMTDEEARGACLAVAEEILSFERAHFERCLSGGHGESYDASIRKQIEALHEPRAISYADATKAIRDAIRPDDEAPTRIKLEGRIGGWQ